MNTGLSSNVTLFAISNDSGVFKSSFLLRKKNWGELLALNLVPLIELECSDGILNNLEWGMVYLLSPISTIDLLASTDVVNNGVVF